MFRLVSASESFAKVFCEQSFRVNYDELSAIGLIENDKVRKTMQTAREALSNKKFEDATIQSHFAIQQTKWLIESRVGTRRVEYGPWFGGGSPLSDEIRMQVSSMYNDLRERVEDVLNVSLSAPFASKLRHLERITRANFFPIDDKTAHLQVLKDLREGDPGEEDAGFALDLATEYILWAQDVYGMRSDESIQTELFSS